MLTTKALQKLGGSRLQTVMTFKSFPEDLEFLASAMFVTKEEMIYVLDHKNNRILRIDPAESFEPVVVGQVPAEHQPDLRDLFVTEDGTIYFADNGQRKVLVIRPGDTAFTEVLQCPDDSRPVSLVFQDRSLYVSMAPGGVYEYELPPVLQL